MAREQDTGSSRLRDTPPRRGITSPVLDLIVRLSIADQEAALHWHLLLAETPLEPALAFAEVPT
jgi:hypothetical protein